MLIGGRPSLCPRALGVFIAGMRIRSFLFLGSLLFALALPVHAEAPRLITLQSGHSLVLTTPGLTQVAVGDKTIVAAVPIGTNEVVINAKGPGHTSIFVWYGGTRVTYELTVTPQVLDDLAEMVRSAISEPHITVVAFDRAVVVRGNVDDNNAFSRVSDIINRFVPYAKKINRTIVNAVVVKHPLGMLGATLAKLPGVHDLRIDGDDKGDIIVSGQVHDQTQEQMVMARAGGMAGIYLSATGKVIDRLVVDTTSQIDVKVYVLEIDKTGLSQLGSRLQSASPVPYQAGAPQYSFGDPNFPIIEGPASQGLGGALKLGAFFRLSALAPTIDLLTRTGHARLLSNPDLVTVPGKKATFLVGGEIPYLFVSGPSQTSVVFKEYGVKLEVTPKIQANGSVDSIIAPDVSSLDFQNAVTLFGTLVPALKESKLRTEIVTKSGQGIVMGGLLQHVQQRDIDKIPLLGDLPIIGRLFRSVRYQNSQTDVVFVVEPVVITQ